MVRPNNNLDPLSQPWGRSIEQDVDRLAENLDASNQNTASVFRSINATLTRLGNQITDLTELTQYQVEPDTRSIRQFNFSLSAVPTVSIGATVTFTKPSWANRATVTAIGDGYLVSDVPFAVPIIGVAINETVRTSIEMSSSEGASAIPYMSSIASTTVLDPCPDTFTCQTIFYVLDPSDWFTGEGNRIANMNATVIFTR